MQENISTQPNPVSQIGNQIAKSPLVDKIMPKGSKKPLTLVLIGFGVVMLGILTGWLLTGGKKGTTSSQSASGVKVTSKEAGVVDGKTYTDTAEGLLEEGGISGEGTHHLTRPGGASQTVYVTSTVIDLQSFVGNKVQVWGETISGKKAGWLMDVGKIKVLE